MLTIEAAGSILAFLTSATLVSAHGHVHSWTVNGKEEAGFFPSYPPALGPTAMRPNASPGRGASDYHTAIVACGDTSPGTGVLTWDVDAGSTVTANWGDWPISHMGPILEYMARCPGTSCDGVVADTLDWFKISQEGYDGAAKLWATEKLSANPTWSFQIPADLAPGPYLVRHELIALHSGTKEVYPTCWQANLIGTGTAIPTDTVKFPDAYKINTDFETWDVNTDLDNSAFVPPGPAVYAGGGGGAAPAPVPVPASSFAAAPASSSSAAPAVSSAAAPAPASSSAAAPAPPSVAASASSSVVGPASSLAAAPIPSSMASSAAPIAPPASSAAPAPVVTAPVITPPVDEAPDECTEDESPEGECSGEEEEEAPPAATSTVVTHPGPATTIVTPPVETSPVTTPPVDTPEVVTPPTTPPAQSGSLGGPAPTIIKEGEKFIVNGSAYNFEGDAKYASCMSQMNKCKNWANGLPNAEVEPAFALCDSQAATCHTGSRKREVIQRYSRRALVSF